MRWNRRISGLRPSLTSRLSERCLLLPVPDSEPNAGVIAMLKFIGSTVGIIFLIGLLVVIGLFMLIF